MCREVGHNVPIKRAMLEKTIPPFVLIQRYKYTSSSRFGTEGRDMLWDTVV